MLVCSQLAAQNLTVNEPTYSFKYPKDWTATRLQDMMAVMAPSDGEGDSFRENLNIVWQPTSMFDNADLDWYVNTNISQLQDMGVSGIKRSDYVVGKKKLKGYLLVYTTDKFSNGAVDQKLWQLFVLHNDKYFVISYSSLEPQFEKYLLQIQQIVSTIRFK